MKKVFILMIILVVIGAVVVVGLYDEGEEEPEYSPDDPTTWTAEDLQKQDMSKITTENFNAADRSVLEGVSDKKLREHFESKMPITIEPGTNYEWAWNELYGNNNVDMASIPAGANFGERNIQVDGTTLFLGEGLDVDISGEDGNLRAGNTITESGSVTVHGDGKHLTTYDAIITQLDEDGKKPMFTLGANRFDFFNNIDDAPEGLNTADYKINPEGDSLDLYANFDNYFNVEIEPGVSLDIYAGKIYDDSVIDILQKEEEGYNSRIIVSDEGMDVAGAPPRDDVKVAALSDRYEEHEYSVETDESGMTDGRYCRYTECVVDGEVIDLNKGERFEYYSETFFIDGRLSEVKSDKTDTYIKITKYGETSHWIDVANSQKAGEIHENTDESKVVLKPEKITSTQRAADAANAKLLEQSEVSFQRKQSNILKFISHFSSKKDREVVWNNDAYGKQGFIFKDELNSRIRKLVPMEALKFHYPESN